jgi:predicted dehydrogenase
MKSKEKKVLSRRKFIEKSAIMGATSLFAANTFVHAGATDKIRVGLIGCGGRGTGAGIIDCAESSTGIELVAMGDLFEDHLAAAPDLIKGNLAKRGLPVKDIYKVTPETAFAGFDAYKKVIASNVDMVILATPPNFRPEHLREAVSAGKHVFMEKPVAVDPAGVRSVLKSAEMAREKGLTLISGTQMRRLQANREIMQRIHSGAIGTINGGQCVRHGSAMRTWQANERVKKSEWSDMEYQIRRWLFWTWLSGDFVVEMHVHNLDIMNWALQSHPVKCMGVGGRQARTGLEYGNIYDHFSVEFEYPDDVRIGYIGTQIDNFTYRGDQRLTGTKGSVVMDFRSGLIKGEHPFEFTGESPDPSVLQYKEMVNSIRNGTALNEGKQIAESTMTAILGRMSAYTGKEISWDWAMNESKLDLSPPVMQFGDKDPEPVAVPGITDLI